MARPKKEKKIDVEELQENHLSGPADEPMEVVEKEMKANDVVVVKEMPKYERVVFRNQRDPGHPLEFHFSSATHPFKMYKLIDGHTYDLPLEVIRNLESCRENIHKYKKNEDGIPQIYIAGYKTHFVCERAA